MFLKLVHKIEREGRLPNIFQETSTTLTPNPETETETERKKTTIDQFP
jgi:hypothetical protein